MTATLTPPQTRPVEPRREVRRNIRTRAFDDKMTLASSLASSLAITWLLFHFIFFTAGIVGFVVFWYLMLLVVTVAITAVNHPRPVVYDRLATTLVSGAVAVMAAVLFSAIGFVFFKGFKAFYSGFLTHDMAGVAPQAPLHEGGIEHAIVGSLIELGIALLITIPLGLLAAIYLTEVGGRLALFVRAVIEAMTALPSIVAGLFIYTLLIVDLHYPRTGFAAARSPAGAASTAARHADAAA